MADSSTSTDPDANDESAEEPSGDDPAEGDGPAKDAKPGDEDGPAKDNEPTETGKEDEPAETEQADEPSEDELLAEIEEKYDFDNFGPSDMAEMSPDEWEVAFDPDAWITGPELIDRVEQELLARIAQREVFAVLERVRDDSGELLLAYSDQDYVLIYPDGTVEGTGTVLRDVKPTIALCSMQEYEPQEVPEGDFLLPRPEEVPEQSSEIGNLMIQIIAGTQLLAGVGLMGVSLYLGVTGGGAAGTWLITGVAGLAFITIAVFLFITVANARLSDRFRSEEYKERLRAVGLEDGERPDFLPIEDTDTEILPVRNREELDQ